MNDKQLPPLQNGDTLTIRSTVTNESDWNIKSVEVATTHDRVIALERAVESLKARGTELERENERQADYQREQADYE